MAVPYIGVMANTSCRIKTLWAKFAEIAGAFREGRYRYTRSFTLAIAEAFVIAEEEIFVTLDGATESAAELIALERFDALRKKTFCVERIIAEKFPKGTVKRIRTGARDDIGGGAGAVTENSAFEVCVRIRNSAIASTGGFKTKPPSTPLKLSAPSIRNYSIRGAGRLPSRLGLRGVSQPAAASPGVMGTTPG